MNKIGSILEDIDQLVKQAFIPASSGSQGGGQLGQAPQGGSDPQLQQLLQQLPPEIAQQISSLPANQQMQALQLMMAGAAPAQAQQDPSQGGTQAPQDPNKQQGPLESKGEVIGNPPTDLNESTISIRIRDLLDLVSGGSATKSTLKVQEHVDKNNIRQQQLQAKLKQDQEKMKAKQEAEKAQATMASQGGMMGPGGIYGQDPSQGNAQPQQML
jgi:LPS O-antigen subunit length determinant protein (WzzB/FepE family)